MTNLTRILMIFVMSACCDTGVGDGLRSYFNNYYDEMATSSCTALSASYNIRGHIAAIRRTCGSGPSCIDVCKNAKKLRAPRECFDALHIYKRPAENLGDNYEEYVDSGKVGLYTYRYGGCGGNYCGPNYCCCVGK